MSVRKLVPQGRLLVGVGFYEFSCAAHLDVSNRVGAGEEWSGVGTLASPMMGELDSGRGDASVPTPLLSRPYAIQAAPVGTFPNNLPLQEGRLAVG